MKTSHFLLVLFLIGCLSSALSEARSAVVCPKDNPSYFCLPVEQNQNKEITATNFYLVPARIIGLMSNEISAAGYPLQLDAQWDSPFFGAGVSFYDNAYKIMILGGMTRVAEMTEDAYAAIVCHEIGHIIGGEPHQTITGAEWSSSEGQSDFFAASVCLPRYFKATGEKNISARIEKAGFEMMNALRKFDSNSADKTLSRTRPPMPAVKETLINKYPSVQCRYENFRNPTKRPACWFAD